MEKRFILLVTFLSVVMIAMAQPVSDSDTSGSVRSEYCVRGAQYPRITPDHRAQFKVVAPEAKLVQIDLGKKYDLVRNEKGEWLGTTEPLGPGFHYYFLIVDGVRVADPLPVSLSMVAVCTPVALKYLMPKMCFNMNWPMYLTAKFV